MVGPALPCSLLSPCLLPQPKMVVELTAVLLNQLLSGRKSVLDAYGEIVYKAWRDATGACLERIENHLIQDVSVLCRLRRSLFIAPGCITPRAVSARHGIVLLYRRGADIPCRLLLACDVR